MRILDVVFRRQPARDVDSGGMPTLGRKIDRWEEDARRRAGESPLRYDDGFRRRRRRQKSRRRRLTRVLATVALYGLHSILGVGNPRLRRIPVTPVRMGTSDMQCPITSSLESNKFDTNHSYLRIGRLLTVHVDTVCWLICTSSGHRPRRRVILVEV